MENEEKKLEVGYKIKEVNPIKSGKAFEVIVVHPDAEGKRNRFTFKNNDNWTSKREYVDPEGNVKEDYNWKIKIENQLRDLHKSRVGEQSLGFDKSKFEGEKLDV